MHRTRSIHSVVKATVIAGTYGQLLSCCAECHPAAKFVISIQRDSDVLATQIALTNRAYQRTTSKRGVLKGKKMHRTGIGFPTRCTVVTHRTYSHQLGIAA